MSSFLRIASCLAGGALLGIFSTPSHAVTTSTEAIAPKAAEILRSCADHLEQAKTISVTIKTSMVMEVEDTKQEMTSLYEAQIQRPDKIALVLKEGNFSSSIYSDGTTQTIYNPSQNAYIQRPAPDNLDQLLNIGGVDRGIYFASIIWNSNPYSNFMDGVTSGIYAGTTDLDGVQCHHVKFAQEHFEWEAWVAADETSPTLRQLKMEYGNASDARKKGTGLDTLRVSFAVMYTDWEMNQPIPAETFEFALPPDATDASESMSESNGVQVHPLLGSAAPGFDLPVLGGGSARSVDLTSTVVVLDFWATWCGPCRRALPLLEKVADTFEGKPVKFFAVNLEETTETVKKYVEEQKLGLPVALDETGSVGKSFQIETIPSTFLIGADGRIQSVHQGLSTDAEDVLTSEIESLLRGETLTGEAAVINKEAATSAPQLNVVWSYRGNWDSAAFDPALGAIVSVNNKGMVHHLDLAGNKTHEVQIEARTSKLRLGQLNESPELEMLIFAPWGDAVHAFDMAGKELWNKPGGTGIDDVWAGDLTGDGIDEVIIGYNGGYGLHALTSDGQPLWVYKNIGNVWHVAAGDVDGDGKNNVVTTSAAGKIHIFDANGKKVKDISPGFYGSMVRIAETTGTPTAILATGSGGLGEVMGCFYGTGEKQWQITLTDEKSHVDSAAVSPDAKHIAVGMRGGAVYVVDVEAGEVIGKADDQGKSPAVSWATGPANDQLLIVATGKGLNAFAVSDVDLE